MITYLDKPVHPLHFKKEITNNQGISIVRFCSEKEKGCTSMSGFFAQLESYYHAFMRFYTINTDSNLQMVREFNIHDLPTILVFRNGMIVDHITGSVSRTEMNNRITGLLKSKKTVAHSSILL